MPGNGHQRQKTGDPSVIIYDPHRMYINSKCTQDAAHKMRGKLLIMTPSGKSIDFFEYFRLRVYFLVVFDPGRFRLASIWFQI